MRGMSGLLSVWSESAFLFAALLGKGDSEQDTERKVGSVWRCYGPPYLMLTLFRPCTILGVQPSLRQQYWDTVVLSE